MTGRRRAFTAGLLALALAVAGTGAAVAAKDPDGPYEGRGTNVGNAALDQVAIDLDVAKDGTKIRNWVVRMNVICVVHPNIEVQFTTQPMPTMKVNRKGRFRRVFEAQVDGSEARIEVAGKLAGRTIKGGTLSYRVGGCYRGEETPIRWTAKPAKKG
jgi:hypothetical protein